jgi:hypothetical protein
VPLALGPQELDDPRDERHVRPGEHREAHDVDILVQGGLGHHLRGLPQPGVDHLHPGVAQGSRDHLRSAIVAVQARLGDEDAYLLLSHRVIRRG